MTGASMVMMRCILPFSCFIWFAVAANAQGTNRCHVEKGNAPISDVGLGANKVACALPQLYGVDGLTFPASGIEGPIDQHPNIGNNFIAAERQQVLISSSINSNIAGQIALLPSIAPASGITFTFDKSLGTFTESQDSFGPIFSERASTTGRHRLSVGFSYQYLNFDSLSGIDLHKFQTTFTQRGFDDPTCASVGFPAICTQTHDYITAINHIDLSLHQLTSFVTFGLTRDIDVSVAIPYVRVRLSATADATVVENSGGQTEFAGCNGVVGDCGPHNVFTNARHAGGLGDITFRVKGRIRRWERAGLGAGLDVRAPTGKAINLLGAGTVGIKPFVVWSYAGRVSPHVNVGYEWSGKSILGADVATGQKRSLPGEFLYSAGLEVGIKRRLTATFDLIGQRIFNGPVDSLVEVPVPGPCHDELCESKGGQSITVGTSNGSYWISNGNIGLRVRPFGKLLVTGSVLLKLDNGGLRSKATPLVSATYRFN